MDFYHRVFHIAHRLRNSARVQDLLKDHPRFPHHAQTAAVVALAVFLGCIARQASSTSAIEHYLASNQVSSAEFVALFSGLGLHRVQDPKMVRNYYKQVTEISAAHEGIFMHSELPIVLVLNEKSEFLVFALDDFALNPRDSNWIPLPLRIDALHQSYLKLTLAIKNIPPPMNKPRSKRPHFEIQY